MAKKKKEKAADELPEAAQQEDNFVVETSAEAVDKGELPAKPKLCPSCKVINGIKHVPHHHRKPAEVAAEEPEKGEEEDGD